MRTQVVIIALLVCGTALAADTALPAPLSSWAFDEPDNAAVFHDAAGGLDVAGKDIARERGVLGNALSLKGPHALRADIAPKLQGLTQFSIAAWTRPEDLSGYREIFRIEANAGRVLFSYQMDGSVLSLGLDAGGYEECDAGLDADEVLDGGWHHCAATYDGKTMRVYLDGVEIGARDRNAPLVVADAPGFIGSSGGTNEFFQGGLDDVSVYAAALTPEAVAALHARGVETVLRSSAEEDRLLAEVYAPMATFGETVEAMRAHVAEKKLTLDKALAAAAAVRIRARFPEECRRFADYTRMRLKDYIASSDASLDARLADSLLTLLMEYRPISERQWADLTDAQRAVWAENDAIAARFDALKQRGAAAAFSPEWPQVMLDAGARIAFRPHVNEPVAPYVEPYTPETRTLTAAEARAALEKDWLFQANGAPSPERIRQECDWARQLAARLAAAYPGKVNFDAELAELDRLEPAPNAVSPSNPEKYFKVRAIKRRIMFANPAVDFDTVLFVDMPYPQGSEWRHETRHRLGYMAVPGARLLTLKGLEPGGALSQLMPQAPFHGSFWRPDLSFDGSKVVFCFKPHNEKTFHLFEIGIDGSNPTQLTSGIYDDFDPIYLPDGEHILFSTSRGNTYVRCMPPTNAYPLARCDRDGKNIYILSQGNEPEYLPSVLDDGRVIYTRWEYTDKPLWRAQSLWTMHPDGTQPNTFWGNQSVWPDLLKDARGIPGSKRVLFTGSAHHDWFSGSVGIVDPEKGANFPDGLTKVTADVPWPECGNGPTDPIECGDYHVSGAYNAYYSPYPLSEEDFIVSACRDGKFLLYLMDTHGNRELIYEGVNNIFHAIPVKPRPVPAKLLDNVVWPTREEREHPKNGVIYSNNVYQGAPEVLRGKAKFLRILSIEHKTYSYWYKRPYISTGPVVSAIQSDGVKRILGTVPIEEDGSVSFSAPPGLSLHFQLLDERGRALQTMRSFVGVMPGEQRGCLGCHERHSIAPVAAVRAMASSRPPSAIAPPSWGEDSVSYARYVRPTLDNVCGKCHENGGKGQEKVDFTPRAGYLGFDESYWLLTGRPSWGQPYKLPDVVPPGFGIADTIMVEAFDQRDPAAYATPAPMTKLSYVSRLVDMASSGKHHGVVVEPEALEKLILWVDTMCPYEGSDEVRAMSDPEFQGVDWLSIRPLVHSAPVICRPGPVDN